jgi:hypothetical protein
MPAKALEAYGANKSTHASPVAVPTVQESSPVGQYVALQKKSLMMFTDSHRVADVRVAVVTLVPETVLTLEVVVPDDVVSDVVEDPDVVKELFVVVEVADSVVVVFPAQIPHAVSHIRAAVHVGQ